MDVARIAELIRSIGEPVTLGRQTSVTPQAFNDVDVIAKKLDGLAVQRLVGTVIEGEEFYVVEPDAIAAQGWPAPPSKGDRWLMSGAKTASVTRCETKKIGTAVAFYVVGIAR